MNSMLLNKLSYVPGQHASLPAGVGTSRQSVHSNIAQHAGIIIVTPQTLTRAALNRHRHNNIVALTDTQVLPDMDPALLNKVVAFIVNQRIEGNAVTRAVLELLANKAVVMCLLLQQRPALTQNVPLLWRAINNVFDHRNNDPLDGLMVRVLNRMPQRGMGGKKTKHRRSSVRKFRKSRSRR